LKLDWRHKLDKQQISPILNHFVILKFPSIIISHFSISYMIDIGYYQIQCIQAERNLWHDIERNPANQCWQIADNVGWWTTYDGIRWLKDGEF